MDDIFSLSINLPLYRLPAISNMFQIHSNVKLLQNQKELRKSQCVIRGHFFIILLSKTLLEGKHLIELVGTTA